MTECEDGVSRSDPPGGRNDVTYGIDARPPLVTSLVLGIQHVLTMAGGLVAPPLILGAAMGMPDTVTARFIGTYFVVAGVATLAQTTLGNRYPIVQGPPASMLVPALAIVSVVTVGGGMQGSWQAALLQIQGAIIVAGVVEVCVGYLGLIGRVRGLLSPVVIAPVIMLIGLSLFDLPQLTATDQNWILVVTTAGLIVLLSQSFASRNRLFSVYSVLVSLVVVWTVATLLSIAGVYTPGTPGYVDLSLITQARAVQPIYPLQWGLPAFTPAFIAGMIAGVVASMVESVGDYYAVSDLVGDDPPSTAKINHGIGMEGLTNVFSGVMGTSGSTSYSQNIAAIGLTGVASRYVVQVGAVVMVAIGYVGYVGMAVATLPEPIIAGMFVALFGQIVAIGISHLQHVDLDSSRAVFVVGIALFVGLVVPEYMANFASIASFRAAFGFNWFSDALVALLGLRGTAVGAILAALVRAVADTIYVICSTEMSIGGTVALVLDNTIRRDERGGST